VDDHTLVRAGIQALLNDMTNVTVVAEAGDGHEALHLIETHRPDIAVIDVAMDGLNGLETALRISQNFPEVRVVMLSVYANEEYVMQALRNGASAYLLMNAAVNDLEFAIRAVIAGETSLSPAVSKKVVEYLRRFGSEGDRARLGGSPFERLTPRQREVLQLIAEGYSTQDIAQTLNISVKTVETHRAQLMQRLDIHDIAGLVRYAIREGLVAPDV
jgi:DNA-binding NarL/FixJ family response regulator